MQKTQHTSETSFFHQEAQKIREKPQAPDQRTSAFEGRRSISRFHLQNANKVGRIQKKSEKNFKKDSKKHKISHTCWKSGIDQAEEHISDEMNNIVTYLLKSTSLENFDSSFPEDPNFEEENIEEYLKSGASMIPEKEIENCLNYLESEKQLYDFFDQIFGRAPQLIVKDIIFGMFTILKFFYQFRNQGNQGQKKGNLEEMREKILFSLASCGHLSFSCLKISFVFFYNLGFTIIGQPQIVHFWRKFISAILFLLSDYDQKKCCCLTSLKEEDETEGNEYRPRLVVSKKIRKSRK